MGAVFYHGEVSSVNTYWTAVLTKVKVEMKRETIILHQKANTRAWNGNISDHQ
jgi:hypothetical protein